MPRSLRLADLGDRAVVDGDDRGAVLGVDVDAAARGRVRDHVGGVAGDALAGLRALERAALGDVVGVAGLRGDREAGALGEAGERADQVLGELAVLLRIEEDLIDVPVGVVVGEDRGAKVILAAGGAEVAGGGADSVDGVEGVLAPVVVGVDAIHLPGRREELHPADGAGGGDVEVGAEGGLDPVDRGQHLPRDPVLGSAGLVDRQQERRDRELVDDEVGDADRSRAEVGDREARVRVGRGAVRIAVGLLGDLLVRPRRRRWSRSGRRCRGLWPAA